MSDIYVVIAQDPDGPLRHMVCSRVRFSETSASTYVPIANIQAGVLKEGNKIVGFNGRVCREIVWQGWFLPGDDEQSKKFPWRFKAAAETGDGRKKAEAATHGDNFLSCFFIRQQGVILSATGEVIGYTHLSQTGPVLSKRRMDMAEEGMPHTSAPIRETCIGEWDGVEQSRQDLRQLFKEWESAPTFYDVLQS